MNIMRSICLFVAALFFLPLTLVFSQQAPMLFEKERPKPFIRINNRVLAIVNGKPITVLDVVKQLDLVFYKQYPQYASMPEMRYQFYLNSWKFALEELVDKEMILADAEEVKMEITGAELREEIEKIFGPNVVKNLDEAGLTMDEAMMMVKQDIMLKRMMSVRVQSIAFKDVTPQEIRRSYEAFRDDYQPSHQWTFRVITIKDPDKTKLAKMVQKLENQLQRENIHPDDIVPYIKKMSESGVFTSAKISEEFTEKQGDLSPFYRESLADLEPGSYSVPFHQEKSKAPTVKIFYLKEIIHDEVPSFAEMHGKIKGKLMGEISSRESKAYKDRLRKKYPVSLMDHLTSSQFEPFSLEVNGKKVAIPNL